MVVRWTLLFVVLSSAFLQVYAQSPYWSCPKKLTAKQCPIGKYHCFCGGEKVTYDIECDKIRLMTCKIPKKPSLDCSRYNLCKTCKSHVGKEDKDVCTSCEDPGYEGSQCKTDIDECITENGGCEHECENTEGSYCCHCDPGYSMASDKHGCDRLSCGRPDEEEGLTMTSKPIPDASDWEYETSVEYSCSRLHHVIHGESQRKCDLIGDESDVEWKGQVPHCVVECKPDEEHAQCGVQGVDAVVCDQLGCCYHDDLSTCHMRPGNQYVEFDGVRPMPASPVNPSTVPDTSECHERCEGQEDCLSFAVEQLEGSIQCYLYEHDRQHYIAEGELRADTKSIYYDPVQFQDDIDYKGEKVELQNRLDYGCFKIETAEKYLPLVALSDEKLLTSIKCVDTCRELGYQYAGIKIDECRCGKEIPSQELLDEDFDDENILLNDTMNMICQLNCSGDAGQFCGGNARYTVQVVAQDSRYLGCFDDTIYDMPIRRWERDENKTVDECIKECARIGLGYAGVKDGGACYCGNRYPMGAGVPHHTCDEPCVADKSYHFCGALKYNSVYRTHAVADISKNKVSHFAANLYNDEETLTTTDTMLFTHLPQLQNFVTRKMVLSASVPFMAPEEDHFCSSGECYSPCGSLDMGNQVIGDQDYVTIRQFLVKYSEIKEILEGKNPKQVNVYAQAVYIDTNLVLDYALLVRARQIFIDREVATYFHTPNNTQILNIKDEDEWHRILFEGPYPDLLQQRLSYTCLQILVSTKEQKFINIGYAMLNDLIATPAEDAEQEAMVRSAAALKAKYFGIDFSKTHPVPLYNKEHLVKILETYYNEISIYKNDYDRLHDSTLLYADFLATAIRMNEIHQSTVVNEALVILKNVQESYTTVTAVQAEIEENYNNASSQVEIARDTLIEEVEKDYDQMRRKSRMAFLTGLLGVIKGAATKNFGTIAQTAGLMFGHANAMESAFTQLAALIAQINQIVDQSQEIMSGDNDIIREHEGELVVDLERMVAMKVNIVKWNVMKMYSDLVIEGMTQGAAAQFRIAMAQYCIWGEAFSKAMVDRAEALRQMLEKQAIYDLRKLQEERSRKVLEDAASTVDKRLDVLHVMQEQMLDICVDMNDILMQFCQAYFFENLKECRDEYQPSFGGSMSGLLLKINAAKRDSLYSADTPSSVSRSLVVVNTDDSPQCEDPNFCPINTLNNERHMALTISPGEHSFKDIQKYRVEEVFLEFVGLNLSQATHKMKFFIKNTGLFHDVRDEVFDFLTRPIFLAFEQELTQTGHVTIHANFPDDVHQITPFTTWVIQIVDDEGYLDLTAVKEIKLRFDGSGIPVL